MRRMRMKMLWMQTTDTIEPPSRAMQRADKGKEEKLSNKDKQDTERKNR